MRTAMGDAVTHARLTRACPPRTAATYLHTAMVRLALIALMALALSMKALAHDVRSRLGTKVRSLPPSALSHPSQHDAGARA
jgi:hypothetical protein